MTILERLGRAASLQGDGPAVCWDTGMVSFAELPIQIDAMAARLQASGIGRGTAFAAVSDNCVEMILLYAAAASLEAVFVPVNQTLGAAEVAHIVEHSSAHVLFHGAAHAEIAARAAPGRHLPLERIGDRVDAPQRKAEDRRPGDFLVIYTSGSTGKPKAVVFDQPAEIGGNDALIAMWGMTPADRVLVTLPLGYLYGLSTGAIAGLQGGCSVFLHRRFSPEAVLRSLVDDAITVYHGVPTMFSMLLSHAEEKDIRVDLSHVRKMITAGAKLPLELRLRFRDRFNVALEDYYALTEARPIFGTLDGDHEPVPEGAIGKAAPGAVIRIVGADGRDVAPGEPGELLVRAAGCMLRYQGAPELTAAVMDNGWFRTGDLGRCDAAGFYHLTGRAKDLIIRGGANVSPAEVEETLMFHPKVAAAAVIGIPDDIYGEVPVACIVPRGAATPAEDELIAHCAARLARFKCPVRIRLVDALPLGATGKVDKAAVVAMWEVGS